MNALFAGLIILSTAILCVGIGVASAYYLLTGMLAAFHSSRPKVEAAVPLMARGASASGD